uniref:Catalase core domain-containing protein n=1 Tax=Meloidogyne enterolobii TaxID=390850 RepID=A0A6V7UHG4_MELEN|nr:unnamed protein product [Meloidogyne enterolobii]
MALNCQISLFIIPFILLNILQLINPHSCPSQNVCSGSDPATLQLESYSRQKKTIDTMTTSHGSLIETRTAVLTAGKRGPMLLQDSVFLDELMKFDRERIPERVVHAKGAAAFGYFVVTHDITKYTKASIFAKIGKRTSCFFRFSTVGGFGIFLKR